MWELRCVDSGLFRRTNNQSGIRAVERNRCLDLKAGLFGDVFGVPVLEMRTADAGEFVEVGRRATFVGAG